MAKRFFTWLLIFLGLSILFQSFQSEQVLITGDDIQIEALQSPYSPGEPVVLKIKNSLDQDLTLPSECPSEPLLVEKYANGAWEQIISKEGRYLTCVDTIRIPAKGEVAVDYAPWTSDLFSSYGKYRVILNVLIAEKAKSFSVEFDVQERGFLSSVVYEAFFRPIYNLLIYLIDIFPQKNLGIGIILLTLLIRLLLVVPNQRALKSQRSMLKIQPEIDAIKKKYQGDQQKISLETLALWKQHRVNPIGGCLPLLIQIPILIALFYVVRADFTPYQDYLLYPFLKPIDLSMVDTNFFGILELRQINATWLPILVGFLQFIQMKLSFARIGKRATDPNAQSSTISGFEDPLRMMNQTMVYFMPIMILLMVASLPSGVGLYLAISTIFGILQQWAVMKSS